MYVIWGYQTGQTDPQAAQHHYEAARTHFEAALAGNAAFRSSRVFLVAVLWELGRYDEARQHSQVLKAMGRPQVTQDRAAFTAYVAPVASLCVTDCNGNGSGLQSTKIWDQIICIYPSLQDGILCN